MADDKGPGRFFPIKPESQIETPPVIQIAKSGRKIDRIEVAARAPQNIARLIIQHRFTKGDSKAIIMFNSSFYAHEDGRYVKLAPDELRATISRFIDRNLKLMDGKDIVAPTSWHVKETFAALGEQVTLPRRVEPPCWLGEGRPPWGDAQVITVINGVLNPETLDFFESDPRWFSLGGIAVKYDPKADCPQYKIALDQWFRRDLQARDALQEHFGYLVEDANDLEKILLWVGGPRSGKGTNARILEALHAGGIVKPLLSSFCEHFGAESLTDASIAMFTDARLGKNADTAHAIEKMLAISGRDSPGVARKNKPDFTGIIRARIILLSNELPYLPDASGAMGNRFVLIRFLESFLGNENPNLSRELTAELPGIFNWAIEGLQRLRARGRFTMPDRSADVLQEYIEGSNPLADFLGDDCEFHPDYQIGKDELHSGYRVWTERQGIKRPLGRSQFYRLLAPSRNIDTSCRCDPVTGTTLAADGAKPPRHVHGMRLKGLCAKCGLSNSPERSTCYHCAAPVSQNKENLSRPRKIWGDEDDELDANGIPKGQ
jgi:putative DNA primase/helicase